MHTTVTTAFAIAIGLTGLTGCKGKQTGASGHSPLAISALGLTIDVAGDKPEATDQPGIPGTIHVRFGTAPDWVSLSVAIVTPPKTEDTAKADVLVFSGITNLKSEKLSDGFVVTYVSTGADFHVDMFRTIDGKQISCRGSTESKLTPTVIAACKSLNAAK